MSEFDEVGEAAKKAWSWAWLHQGIFLLFILLVLAFLGGSIFRWTCVTFVDNYEQGFTYDRFAGKIEKLNRTGYIIRCPVKYVVHAIDLRPYQLSITANFGAQGTSGIPARVLNAKLVQFNPAGLDTFVAWHGRDAGDALGNLQEIMKCYAFGKDGGRDCPFITVLSEINPSQTPTLPTTTN